MEGESAPATTTVKPAVRAVQTPIGNQMQNVIVLDIQPFSMANKENNARNKAVWNQLWGLVR